jgi:hypothetical protein
VHEFLLKPTSPRALQERLLSIVMNPRAMVQIGDNYVPAPRSHGGQGESRGAGDARADDQHAA